MQQFIDFVIRHWELWLGFFMVLLFLLIFELHGKLTSLKRLSPHQMTLLINREDAIVLDVRDKNAFDQGHITNAINIPLPELSAKIKQLEPYKNQPIIIVYATGQVPEKVGTLLANASFNKIHIAQGGITAWSNLGLPLVKS